MGSERFLEPLYRPAVVKRILAERGLRPKKALGQNFLVDQNVIERILDAGEIGEGDIVLEIGPGVGALTQGLLRRGAHVTAVEKDAELCALLAGVFEKEPRLHVVQGDALKIDLEAALSHADLEPGGPVKVMSNLPYYITSPLLMRILESELPVAVAVVMVQREVARRLVASPGSKDYGSLTVAVSYWAEVSSAGRVPPTVFYPPPSVESEVVVLRPRPCPYDVGDAGLFRRIVKAAFGKRRKTLQNALAELDLPKETILAALHEADVDPGRRGETLSLAEFARISGHLSRQ